MIRTEQDREIARLRRALYRTYWGEAPQLSSRDTEALLRMEWLTSEVDKVDTHITGSVFGPAPEGEDGSRIYPHTFGVTVLGFREALNFGEDERP